MTLNKLLLYIYPQVAPHPQTAVEVEEEVLEVTPLPGGISPEEKGADVEVELEVPGILDVEVELELALLARMRQCAVDKHAHSLVEHLEA